ncbi:hypothetical protein GPECTOR_6g895 [Gonium pectorale]|uniref:Uncharacterized protein n=1 Tax=Gonium pectorale TaxID=33097 RepID=A0A150GVS7_GONPE|nr:hypothetical protein GPECTOR_6g895 [Gonium pectorale]|eukprot:KXZ53976.1 hypothetical protein GPECTOR_6g895 [Gonium pectorale]
MQYNSVAGAAVDGGGSGVQPRLFPSGSVPVAALGGHASAAARPSAGAGGAAAGGSSSGSDVPLMLRAFHGLMRPEVAPLAAAAAQRAAVTPPSVPFGLYMSQADEQQRPQPAAAGGKGGKRSANGGGAVELSAALLGMKPLPQRVAVEEINDRCHPCFRNPFKGLAAVPVRRKVVARGQLPEGCLLGLITGELRSEKLDERLVGGDLSGAEGTKVAYTRCLLSDLPLPKAAQQQQLGQPGQQQAPGEATDSLIVVADPHTCPLAEANVTAFWGACSTLPPEERTSRPCNCRAYDGRTHNAAVIPCILKVPLSRLKRMAEQTGDKEALRGGLDALRSAAVAAAAPAAGGGAAVAAAVAAVAASSDPYVYGVVAIVVTSRVVKAGEEILMAWDGDESIFAVADQNLRQYEFVLAALTAREAAQREQARLAATLAERERSLADAEARLGELLRQREEESARIAAEREERSALQRECAQLGLERDDARRQLDEALRQADMHIRRLDGAERRLDEALRQRDEAVEQLDAGAARQAAAAEAAQQLAAEAEEVAALRARCEALQQELDQAVRDRRKAERQRDAVMNTYEEVVANYQTAKRERDEALRQRQEEEPGGGAATELAAARADLEVMHAREAQLAARADGLAAERDEYERRYNELLPYWQAVTAAVHSAPPAPPTEAMGQPQHWLLGPPAKRRCGGGGGGGATGVMGGGPGGGGAGASGDAEGDPFGAELSPDTASGARHW